MPDLSQIPLADLFRQLTGGGVLKRLLAAARDEDLADAGDITTESIVPPGQQAEADLVARAAGCVAGVATVGPVITTFGGAVRFEPLTRDGQEIEAGLPLGRLVGSHAAMLTMERTLLNLLGHLSGIATLTARYVAAVAGTRARICETRKTLPGLRGLEKYAVRCGGGHLHRIGLYDAALYKDNHLAHLAREDLGDALATAARAVRAAHDVRFVEVEVDTLEQLRQILAIETGLIDLVLLDNMAPSTLSEAVALRDESAPGVKLEASGGVTLETVLAIAESGVDRISVGALTHSAPALDIGLDFGARPRS